jgi:hypothetical protein
MAIDGIGRPALLNTKYFQRTLKPVERQILLEAGEGDISAGFLVVLDLYRHTHNLGYRPAMALECVSVALHHGE